MKNEVKQKDKYELFIDELKRFHLLKEVLPINHSKNFDIWLFILYL